MFRRLIGAALAAALTALPAAARADGSGAHSISGASPNALCDPPAMLQGRSDMEAEPTLAVNPTNPDNIVAAWIQDWVDEIATTASFDGGETWTTPAFPPGSSHCSGAIPNSTLDEHLSFGPDGRLYLSTFLYDSFLGLYQVTVNTSTDGGRSWSFAKTLARGHYALQYAEWSWVMADPANPATAYAGWFEGSFADRMRMMLSRTTDGGETWSAPTEIGATPPGRAYVGPLLYVLPDGTLLTVFYDFALCPDPEECSDDVVPTAITSEDEGRTWRDPVAIPLPPAGNSHRSDDIGKLGWPYVSAPVLGPGSTVHMVSSVIGEDRASTVYLTGSSDGGRSWTPATPVLRSPVPVMNPNLAVGADGALGLFFYDFRADRAGDDESTTDAWLAQSADGGATWRETNLGRFDASSFPDDLGEYQGAVAVPGGFAVAFAAGLPLATAGPTDILFATVPAR
jgi:hypothetical protein